MAWFGKGFGVGLGALFGGPAGAAVGAILGHALDRWNETEGDTPNLSQIVPILYASVLLRVATADGNFDDRERTLIREILAEVCEEVDGDIGEEDIDDALDHLENSPDELPEVLGATIGAAAEYPDLRRSLLVCAWRVASKDLKVVPAEVDAIAELAQGMGSTEEEFLLTMMPYHRLAPNGEGSESARETLGVTPQASRSEIDTAYRSMCKRFHPDRHQTAATDLQDLASEKLKTLNDAFLLLTNSIDGEAMYGKSARNKELMQVGDRDVVLCFLCESKCRLPALTDQDTARCPECQALLVFEKDTAEFLVAEPEGSGQHTSCEKAESHRTTQDGSVHVTCPHCRRHQVVHASNKGAAVRCLHCSERYQF